MINMPKGTNERLAIHGGAPVIDSSRAKFEWPRITDQVQLAVKNQLLDTISIYDNSNIFGEFEKRFARYHSRKYAQLSNSGTSSIFAMYEAINVLPGDEILCPVYTFHATVSPMMYLGATPVFCDSDDDGNIAFDDIKRKVTNKTKAIVVTHMWGRPVRDILEISKLCKDRDIYLLEDCSHSHGAKIYGKRTGSFGDIAVWSLQGQKTVTGGEGGILATDNKNLYDRALLQGHYNKRPKIELSDNSALKKFSLTGMGLKLRAHPLAIAIANEQFNHLEEFIETRQKYAKMLNRALLEYDFLDLPDTDSAKNSWYAYCIKYRGEDRHGVAKHRFVEALTKEGLIEVDIPGSTGLLNNLPLFCHPDQILPRMYDKDLRRQDGFPAAQRFTDQLIKMPVWSFSDEEWIIDKYIAGFRKVCNYIQQNNGGLLRGN